MNLLHPFFTQAAARGARTAIVAADGSSASYIDLMAQSARLAAVWQRKGIGAGDRVLLAMPLGIALYASLAALWRLGAVVVFPEPALGLNGLRHAVDVTRPKAYLAGGWFRALHFAWPALWRIPMITPESALADAAAGGDPLASVGADHPALISFTSGSTGRPKTIVRSHGFLAHQNACVADLLKPQREDEVDLVAFPVFVLANLGLGVTSVLPNWNLRHHDAADAGSIARHADTHHVTRALIPPSICETLTRGPAIRLDAVFTGGGPVFPDLLERLAARMPQADIVSVYGSTEAEPIAHQHVGDIGADDWRTMKSGGGLLAGAPIRDIQLKILDARSSSPGTTSTRATSIRPTTARPNSRLTAHLASHRRCWPGRRDRAAVAARPPRRPRRRSAPFGVEAAARFWPNVRQAALVAIDGKPVLAIAGISGSRDLWQREADRIGTLRVVAVKSIPLDRRHRSKIDYAALRKLLSAPDEIAARRNTPTSSEERRGGRLEGWPRTRSVRPSFETRPSGAPQDEVGVWLRPRMRFCAR